MIFMQEINVQSRKILTSKSELEESDNRGIPLQNLFFSMPEQVLILPKHSFLSGFIPELLNLFFFQGPLNRYLGAPQEKNGCHRKGDAEELSEATAKVGEQLSTRECAVQAALGGHLVRMGVHCMVNVSSFLTGLTGLM